jgi:hypothetical protein
MILSAFSLACSIALDKMYYFRLMRFEGNVALLN